MLAPHKAAAAAALLLGLSGCIGKALVEIVTPVEIFSGGTDVVFDGAPKDLSRELERNVERLLERFVETGKKSLIDDAAYETELLLHERGYADAVVGYEVLTESTARIDVNAGEESTIGRILVESDPSCPIKPEQLRRYVNGPRKGLFGRGAMLYVRGRVAGSSSRIQEDLMALGHLDAAATLEDPGPRPQGGGVDILLKVVAGPRYLVKDATVGLNRTADSLSLELEQALQEGLNRAIQNEDGSPREYEPRMAGSIRTILSDVLSQGGYPDARLEVSAEIDKEKKEVTLKAVANPGPYVRLAEVTFEGNGRTKPSFMASHQLLRTGDPYDSRKVRDTVRGLFRTGLFSEVSPRLEGEGDARKLVIDIIEQPAREIYAEPGYGSYELARLTLGARHRNLFGSGIGASVEGTIAQRAQRANISITDRWFLRRELIGDLRVEFDRREEPSFTRESRGVGAFTTKEWSNTTTSSIGYRLSRSEATDVVAVDDLVLETENSINVAGIILTHRYDIRDALFAPSSGAYAETSVEFAGEVLGSELEFIRPSITAAWFEPAGADDVIGIGLRMGLIIPSFGEESIPIQERYFAGGENSVRSFRESDLGPTDATGEPLGGEGFATMSVEWRHELGGAFQSALFFDAGLVEAQAEDLFDFESVRTGVGVGLRYLLPIGPLRVDLAFNPDRRSGESEWVVHFGIGMPF